MSHRECFDPFSLGSTTRNSPPSLQTLPFAKWLARRPAPPPGCRRCWPPFWAARVRLPCRPRPRRSGRRAHPGTAEGGRLPGHGLFGIGRPLSVRPQWGALQRGDPPPPARPVHHRGRNPAGGRDPGPGGHLRRGDGRLLALGAGGEPPHRPLAGGQLLWRLLHPNRVRSAPAGADRLPLPGGPGWLRAPAEKPHRRHLAAGDRPARPDRRPVDNPALYRLPPQPERPALHTGGGPQK